MKNTEENTCPLDMKNVYFRGPGECLHAGPSMYFVFPPECCRLGTFLGSLLVDVIGYEWSLVVLVVICVIFVPVGIFGMDK